MIDIHAHIMPGIDDGPQSIEDSIAMLDIAYGDGIRSIILTPHRNHPWKFEVSEHIEEVYAQMEKLVGERYPKLQIHLGCELYISPNYLDILEEKPYRITMSHSRYLLIEFPENIKFKYMRDVIHEIRIRGYIPVIAHVEMYPDIIRQISSIEVLRDEGAYIQVTASSLLRKQGMRIAYAINKLIIMGQVDFIATDCHSVTSRRPILSDAYAYVISHFGKKIAKAIFFTNPKALLDDKKLSPNPLFIKNEKSYSKKHKSVYVLSAVLVAIIISSAFLKEKLLFIRAEIQDVKPDSEISEMEGVQVAELNKEAYYPNPAPRQNQDENQVGIKNGKVQKSKDKIIETYVSKLVDMRQYYEGNLESIVGKIQNARQTIEDEEEEGRIINEYLDDIVNLESDSENKVYHALYEMQTELEEVTDDVSSVQELREKYFDIKEEKRAYYLSMLQ